MTSPAPQAVPDLLPVRGAALAQSIAPFSIPRLTRRRVTAFQAGRASSTLAGRSINDCAARKDVRHTGSMGRDRSLRKVGRLTRNLNEAGVSRDGESVKWTSPLAGIKPGRSRPFPNSKEMCTDMENQHRQIKGYRELSQEEIDLMNEGKALAEQCGAFVEKLNAASDTDKRWVAIGRTHLQEGFMAATRSIAKPTTF